jgi:hypothetical protein
MARLRANSQKVIRNLVNEVVRAAGEAGTSIQCIQKVSEKETDAPGLQFTTKNSDLLSAIAGPCRVAAGTAWLWVRSDAAEALDVLFIMAAIAERRSVRSKPRGGQRLTLHREEKSPERLLLYALGHKLAAPVCPNIP